MLEYLNKMDLNIVTVIQARTGSSRLPGKVLLSAAGKPLLLHMYERVKMAKYTGTIVIATTTNPEDNVIEQTCLLNGIKCFRGHPTDLLDRHYQIAKALNADLVLKIPSDCPLIDPKIIDNVILHYIENADKYDFVSNLRPPSYPDGNDVEVFNFNALEYAWKTAELDYEREHTTPFIWKHPELFNIGNVLWDTGFDYSNSHRWTLDYEEDYTFIRLVYDILYPSNKQFGLYDILNLLEEKPYINKINRVYSGKFWYNNNNEINLPKIGLV